MASTPEITVHIGNQPKMLKKLVYTIFSYPFLAEYTWTGNTSPEEKKKGNIKKKFKDLKNILELLYSTVAHLDKNYSRKKCLSDFKIKILKYAYL